METDNYMEEYKTEQNETGKLETQMNDKTNRIKSHVRRLNMEQEKENTYSSIDNLYCSTNYNVWNSPFPTRPNSPISTYVTMCDTKKLDEPKFQIPETTKPHSFKIKTLPTKEIMIDIEKNIITKEAKILFKKKRKEKEEADQKTKQKCSNRTITEVQVHKVPTPVYSTTENRINDPHAGIKTLIKCAINPKQQNYKQFTEIPNDPNEYQNEETILDLKRCDKCQTLTDIEQKDNENVLVNRLEILLPTQENDKISRIILKQFVKCLFMLLSLLIIIMMIGIIIHIIILPGANAQDYDDRKEKELTELDHKNTAKDILVTHYDCESAEDAKMFSLHEIPKCQLQPKDTTSTNVLIEIFQKSPLKKVEAITCQIEYTSQRWHCGSYSHSTNSIDHIEIERQHTLSKDKCREAIELGYYMIDDLHWNIEWKVPMTFDVRNYKSFHDGRARVNEIDCKGRGFITKYDFTSIAQKSNLTYDSTTGEVLNEDNRPLMCKYEEGGCDSAGVDKKAYVWNTTDSCILGKIKRSMARMVHWKTQERYFVMNEKPNENNTKGKETDEVITNFRFEIYREKERMCHFKFELHRTNYDVIYIRIISGGYNLHTGKKNVEYNPSGYKYDRTYDPEKDTMSVTSQDPTNKNTVILQQISKTQDFNITEDTINYNAHIGSALDYLFHEQTQMLRTSEMEILQKICEIERTQLLTILAIAINNPELAGYLLTNNRSNFITVDNSIAYMYSCAKKKTATQYLEFCYKMIPILYKEQTMFVDPQSRQTYPKAEKTPCDAKTGNMFHMDLDDPNSWYKLNPWAEIHKPPKHFSATQAKQITGYSGSSYVEAGLHTQLEIDNFWKLIQSKRNENQKIKKITDKVYGPDIDNAGTYSNRRFRTGMGSFSGPIYIDRLISPEFFMTAFTAEFGKINYYLTIAGTYFAVILLIKFIAEMIGKIYQGFEIKRLTDNTMGAGKLIIASLFNVLYITAMDKQFVKRKSPIDLTVNGNNNNDDDKNDFNQNGGNLLSSPYINTQNQNQNQKPNQNQSSAPPFNIQFIQPPPLYTSNQYVKTQTPYQQAIDYPIPMQPRIQTPGPPTTQSLTKFPSIQSLVHETSTIRPFNTGWVSPFEQQQQQWVTNNVRQHKTNTMQEIEEDQNFDNTFAEDTITQTNNFTTEMQQGNYFTPINNTQPGESYQQT